MTSAPSPAQTLPQQPCHLQLPPSWKLPPAVSAGLPWFCLSDVSGASPAHFRDVFLSLPPGSCVPQLFPPSSALLTPYETVSDLI